MTPIDKLIALDRETPKRIAIVGDAMTDIYVHGHFGTCQEECYKFIEERRVSVPGGAANAARQLENWDCDVEAFCHDLPVKTRFLVNGKYVFRHDDDCAITKPHPIEISHLSDVEFDAILISDYDKGFLTPDFIREVIDLANERGIPVVSDMKRDAELYRGCFLKCNQVYAEWIGIDYCKKTADDFGLVITHGGCSPSIYLTGKTLRGFRSLTEETKVPTSKPVRCINHVGAGDSFAAHLTLALAHGLSLEDAAAIAHSAGRCYVQHEHNRPPWPHELRKDIDPVGGKVLSGLRELEALRQSTASRIVFSPGVFRLPHAGHCSMLRWAREQGEALVVGVNMDESAARLKQGEFCLPLKERIAMLASMEAVDWIVAFDGDEPREEIAALRPDVMVKGPDYAGKAVCCADLVNDIRFAPAGDYPDMSASGIVATIVERKT